MFRTLFSRLAGTLIALSLVLSLALVLILQSSHGSFHLEVEQKLHRHLAERLVARLPEGAASLSTTFDQIRQLGLLNPKLAAYAVQPDGTITASSKPPVREAVSVAPILEFIQGPAAWPLPGDDPALERGKAIFSAARMPQGGYLYVVLDSDGNDPMPASAPERSYSLREALWLTLVNVAVALVLALAVIALVTRPVKRLRHVMEFFDASGFSGDGRYGVARGHFLRDEIDRLGEIFDSMADRMAAQIDSLRRADQARRDLYANVSHDLVTPLTSLHGYVETLLMKDHLLTAAQRKRYLEIVNRQSQQLRELIDQITDLARLETVEIRALMRDLAVDELLQDLVEDMKPLLDRKALNVALAANAPVPPLPADAGLLRRALRNILVNAVQAAPEGSEIRIAVLSQSGNVDITITDEGPGLSAEAARRIFEPHYRVFPRIEPGSPGMGLGLAIARKIVELHGGKVEAGNAPGGGAAMRVTLPASQTQK